MREKSERAYPEHNKQSQSETLYDCSCMIVYTGNRPERERVIRAVSGVCEFLRDDRLLLQIF